MSEKIHSNPVLLPPATKLGQGNIFRSVCPHSVHRGGMRGCSGGACMVVRGGMHGCSGGGGVHGCWGACVIAPGGRHAWDTMRYRDTVNEQMVRILLECILVE